MQRVTPERPWPLFDVAAIRRVELAAAAGLPPHTLMQRAGLAVARLALAIAPHARRVWVACGPGNNGGDGLEASVHLKQWGKDPVVSWLGSEETAPADARASLQRARAAGVAFTSAPPAHWDLGIDALLGIGSTRAPEGALLEAITHLNDSSAPVLAVDLPSGMHADTGQGAGVVAHHTLSLLALKPGLFTANGRDAAGQVWLDDLGVPAAQDQACAWLAGPAPASPRPHASHKGSFGDVAVIGGASGMVGAALLAATAALHAGAGRIYVAVLGEALACDAAQPELMFRPWDQLPLGEMTVAAGCGGGVAIGAALPRLLSTAAALVLDADALNAIAVDSQLQALLEARGRRHRPTVLTPHPLEAARLLGSGTQQVQADRIGAAREMARRFQCVVVLKGSGTVTAQAEGPVAINPTGNGRLATAGTGDVLAGMVAARLAQGEPAFDAARAAAYRHGAAADVWPAGQALTASALARRT